MIDPSRIDSRCRQRGAALLTAMIIVALVATLAGSMVWQQWRAIQVEAAERARTQSAWILSGALDWARLILREDAKTAASRRQRRSSRRAVGGPARRSAPLDLPRRRQGQHRRRARRVPVRHDHRRDGALQPDQSARCQAAASTSASCEALERLCETVGVSADVATRIATGLRDAAPPVPPAPGSSAPAPRPPADPPLMPQSAAQLGWLGVDAESLRALDPYIVLIPDTLRLRPRAYVNVNTAPREVLVAVVDKLDLATAERIVQSRQRAPLKGVADLTRARPRRAGRQPESARVPARTTSRCAGGCASATSSSSSARS